MRALKYKFRYDYQTQFTHNSLIILKANNESILFIEKNITVESIFRDVYEL